MEGAGWFRPAVTHEICPSLLMGQAHLRGSGSRGAPSLEKVEHGLAVLSPMGDSESRGLIHIGQTLILGVSMKANYQAVLLKLQLNCYVMVLGASNRFA